MQPDEQFNAMLKFFSTWYQALHLQYSRAREHNGMTVSDDYRLIGVAEAERHLYATTLAQVRAAVAGLSRCAPLSARPGIKAALDDFDRKVPSARKVRNALTHFDEYVEGKGRLQKAAGAAPEFRLWGSARIVRNDDGKVTVPTYTINVSYDSNQPPIAIDLLESMRAAIVMSDAVESHF